MAERIYDTRHWHAVREEVLTRDGRCVYALLLGDACDGPLHVHHLNPDVFGPYDPEGLITICEHHHPKLESIRRALLKVRGWKACPHQHRTRESREQCERRLNSNLAAA